MKLRPLVLGAALTAASLSASAQWLPRHARSAEPAARSAPQAPPPALAQFAWRQPIALPEPAASVYRLALPPEVYAHAACADLGDLRIYNGAGELVPHALLRDAAPAETVTATVPLRYFALRGTAAGAAEDFELDVHRSADGRLAALRLRNGPADTTAEAARPIMGYVLDASALRAPAGALELSWTPAPDGLMLAVALDASDDLQHWRPLVRDAQLVELRMGEERLLRNRIEFGATRAKYLRLRWPGSGPALALTAAAATTRSVEPGDGRMRWSAPVPARTTSTPGEYLADSGGLPVHTLRIALPQPNTVAPLRIYRRADTNAPWREVAGTIVFRLQRDGHEIGSPDIALTGGRERLWRLVVDQRGGGLGAGTPDLSFAWTPQQIVFVARGQAPYTLASGDATVAPASFDIATLVPGYRPEQFEAIAEAGVLPPDTVPTATASGAAERPAETRIDWRTAGLWAVLTLGVLALAGMAWKLLSHRPPSDPPGGGS